MKQQSWIWKPRSRSIQFTFDNVSLSMATKTWKTSVQRSGVKPFPFFDFLIFVRRRVASGFARALQYPSIRCKSMLDCGDFLEKPTIRWKRRHKNPRWLAPKERTEAGAQRGLVFPRRSFYGSSCFVPLLKRLRDQSTVAKKRVDRLNTTHNLVVV